MIDDINKIIKPIKQFTPDGKELWVYPADHLIELRRIGMKLDPTFANVRAFDTKGLVSDEELALYPICDGKVTRYIYLNPEFWTEEKLRNNEWRFGGTRCLPGKTFTYDEYGNITSGPYRLYILDIDSEGAFLKCQKLLEE